VSRFTRNQTLVCIVPLSISLVAVVVDDVVVMDGVRLMGTNLEQSWEMEIRDPIRLIPIEIATRFT
jgi:hypothetical protein